MHGPLGPLPIVFGGIVFRTGAAAARAVPAPCALLLALHPTRKQPAQFHQFAFHWRGCIPPTWAGSAAYAPGTSKLAMLSTSTK